MKKASGIVPVYNHGVVAFQEKQKRIGKYGTVIHGEYDLKEIRKDWYRIIGVSSEENFHAHSLEKQVDLRIAVKWLANISSSWLAVIDGKHYSIFRVYQNAKRNETEISLMEVES